MIISASVNKTTKSCDWDIIHQIYKILDQRATLNTPTIFNKVKSHSGNQDNDHVDINANKARDLPELLDDAISIIPDNTFFIMHNHIPILCMREWIIQ